MIRLGIVGYGNLGRGVERALRQNPDFELAAVFTRREPSTLRLQTPNVKADTFDNLAKYKDKLDVVALCGGSATDLPIQAPEALKHFSCVDSFDTHAEIPGYMKKLEAVTAKADTLALVSTGWDPGLFSLMRLYFESLIPGATSVTFWGKGVSQGHSDAIRRIAGVKRAIQYTIPKEAAVAMARSGKTDMNVRDKHLRECFVVADENDQLRIETEIKHMHNYFEGYDVVVHFISEAEFNAKHTKMPHGGLVLAQGMNGGALSKTEFSLSLQSNPDFTAGVIVAFARALYRLKNEGKRGVITVFDVPPIYLMRQNRGDAIASLL